MFNYDIPVLNRYTLPTLTFFLKFNFRLRIQPELVTFHVEFSLKIAIHSINPEIIMKQSATIGAVLLLVVAMAALGFAYPRTVLLEDYTNYS